MKIPTPMLVFDLKGAGAVTFAGSTPIQRTLVESREPPPPLPALEENAIAAMMPITEELPGEAPFALPEWSDPDEPPEAVDGESDETQTHRMKLIIDSLPGQQLIKTIPVTVESLGDKVFTATVHALNLKGTGNTLGDALLALKEQIEISYQQLRKMRNLNEDEKGHLRFLESHIKAAPPPASDASMGDPKKSIGNTPKSKRLLWR